MIPEQVDRAAARAAVERDALAMATALGVPLELARMVARRARIRGKLALRPAELRRMPAHPRQEGERA